MFYIDPFLKEYIRKFLVILLKWGLLIFLIVQLGSCYPTLLIPFQWGMRMIYQPFGAKEDFTLKNQEELYLDYQDPKPDEIVDWAGWRVKKTFMKRYIAKGTVAYLDMNDALIKGWYLAAGQQSSKMYKDVVPYDLFLIMGKMADPENMKKIVFGHEENGGTFEHVEAGAFIDEKEYTNIHIIPATSLVKKVLSTLKKNDVVQLEGYLVFWQGTGHLSRVRFHSALQAGQISHQKAGGNAALLCKQLYLTKIIVNGYAFQ